MGMRVSELAAKAGTTAKAIRFYEAEGVLPPPVRAQNRYRDYGEADLCRVRIVLALRGLGLDLAESGRLAELCATGRCDVMEADLAVRVAERRAAVSTAMAELAHLDVELASVEQALAAGEPHSTLCLGKEDG